MNLPAVQSEEKKHFPEVMLSVVESVFVGGDLSKLKPNDRMRYYDELCRSLKLNPLTRPFDYISMKGKLTLYTKKDATDQLRRIFNVTTKIISKKVIFEGIYEVVAVATLPDGRSEEASGCLFIANLKGEDLANALMKCETKAKRRATLAICGLGFVDESEIGDIRDARIINAEMIDEEIERLNAEQAQQKQTPQPQPTQPKEQPTTKPLETPASENLDPSKDKPTGEQLRTLVQLAKEKKGWINTEITDIVKHAFGINSSLELNMTQYKILTTIVTEHTYAESLARLKEERSKQGAVDVGF